jgi:hypothetical protein
VHKLHDHFLILCHGLPKLRFNSPRLKPLAILERKHHSSTTLPTLLKKQKAEMAPTTKFLTLLLLCLSMLLSTGLASPLQKRCTNAVANPSFESGLSPYLDMVVGAWESRGVYTSAGGGHTGLNFYYGHSNATVDSTLTLAQSGLKLPQYGEVEVSAWVASNRPGNVGSTHVEVFLDGVLCGSTDLGTTGWVKVGGKGTATASKEDGSTIAVVVLSEHASSDGWSVWLDDFFVGSGDDC